MNINYEYADKTDIEPIFELNKSLINAYEDLQLINYEKVLSQVKSFVETHIQEYICVILNDEIAGYYHLCLSEEKMQINDLFLFPPYRNRGIGTEILKKIISETALPISLCVFIRNVRAIALYQKFGFQIAAIYNGTRYIMQRS